MTIHHQATRWSVVSFPSVNKTGFHAHVHPVLGMGVVKLTTYELENNVVFGIYPENRNDSVKEIYIIELSLFFNASINSPGFSKGNQKVFCVQSKKS